MGGCTVERRELRRLVDQSADRITGFARRLVQTPSLSGEEGAVATLVADEMRSLRYDDVQVDPLGNVVGRIGGGGGHTTMLHAHMDIVAPGDASRWQHPPYGGEIVDGYLWGRGASDTKGSLAAQVYAAGLLREAHITPPGDVYQAAVVCEETGGLGTRHLVTYLLPDVAIIGEPSANTLRRGHRGRFEFVITLHGVPAHASAPARGINPHFSMGRFLLALRDAPLVHDPVFGGSSVAPTLMYVDGQNSNVIPGRLTVHLDWRASPADSEAHARALLEGLLADTLEEGVRAEVDVRTRPVRTYTGVEREVRFVLTGYVLEDADPRLVAARESLVRALGRPVEVGVWTFCTDGGHLAAAGVPCIGFGPGGEDQAHVYDERLSIDELLEATVAYMALALNGGS